MHKGFKTVVIKTIHLSMFTKIADTLNREKSTPGCSNWPQGF